jgi:hypothetical protein
MGNDISSYDTVIDDTVTCSLFVLMIIGCPNDELITAVVLYMFTIVSARTCMRAIDLTNGAGISRLFGNYGVAYISLQQHSLVMVICHFRSFPVSLY